MQEKKIRKNKMSEKSHNLWQKYFHLSSSYILEGNKIFIDVVKILIGGGTFLFVLTGAFSFKIEVLPICLKIILIISWAFIVISFIFGIRQLITESNFYGKWSDLYRKAMDELSKCDDENLKEKLNSVFNGEERISDLTNFWLQLIFIGVAFMMQVVVVSIYIFL